MSKRARDDASSGGHVPIWRRYLRFLRSNPAADVDDELAFHIQSTIDELTAAGMTPDDARAAAREKFGNVDDITHTLYTLSEERERRMARSEWLDTLRHDLVFALRQLRKAPAFTAVAVLTLALGIGANSAIFSVVYSVLLNPLPYANADRIYSLEQQNGDGSNCCTPHGNFFAWQREATAFEAMGALWGGGTSALTGEGEPLPVTNFWVSAGYWKVMRVPPITGRYFTDDEDRYNAPRVAVISYALWQSKFSGDRNIIGRSITLNANPVTIVGVAPPDYITTPPAERIWTPLAAPPSRFTDFSDHELSVYGLLKRGVSPAAAAAQLRQIDTRLAREHPHSGYDGGVIAKPLVDAVVGSQRGVLYMLLGAVTLVLLIACVNIANLLMARASVRRPEIAIRGALGATRSRIVAQMLTESVLLAVAGGVVGLVIGAIAMRFLVSSPVIIPRLQQATMNGPVLAFTAALTLVCALVFGLVPALRASRLDLQQILRDGGRESRGSARDRLRGVLVIAELSLAQVLLVGAALLIKSAMNLQAVPVGFDTHNLLAVSVNLPQARYKEDAAVNAAFEQIQAGIAAIPGVRGVGRAQVAPIYDHGWSWTVMREGSNGHDDAARGSNMRGVSPGYFAVLGLPVVRGREFNATDGANGQPVAIVSRRLAKELFGNSNPIGRRISNGSVDKPRWREIVGVVDDMHADGPSEDPPLEMYIPSAQFINSGQTILVRGSVPVATLLPQIRRAVAGVDPLVPLTRVMTMDDALGRRLAMPRFTMLLLALLGGTGLVLAIVGVYGVVAYFVTQRTRELGVRIALGASAGAVQGLVVRRGLTIALIGVVIGGGLAFAATRVLRTMVFGITPHDPWTYVVVAGVLALVASAASYIPARRATRIDPLEALRSS